MNGIPSQTKLGTEHGKPHLEQDQVGKYSDVNRRKVFTLIIFRVDRWILMVTSGLDK